MILGSMNSLLQNGVFVGDSTFHRLLTIPEFYIFVSFNFILKLVVNNFSEVFKH